MTKVQTHLPHYLAKLYGGIIALVPFTTLLSVWLSTRFGMLDVLAAWKEVVIFLSAFVVLLWVLRTPRVREQALTAPWTKMLVTYVALHILVSVNPLSNGTLQTSAFVHGLISNLRYLGFFWVVWVISLETDWLRQHWQKFILIPAAVVVVFGLLQITLLPLDALTHVGYGPRTVVAFQTVDNNIDYQRIQSTLRGANPLGAYLLFILPLVFIVGLKKWQKVVACMFVLVALYFTYSRSAAVGMAIAVGCFVFLQKPSQSKKIVAGILAVSTLLLLSATTVAPKTVENVLFHTSSSSTSAESSNDKRESSMRYGLSYVISHPFGTGAGSSGPASFRNKTPLISENYYLQIAEEVGWAGLILFLFICVSVLKSLFVRRSNELAAALFASFMGLSFVNVVQHGWADDTVSLLWWGLAGIAISYTVDKHERKKTTTKA